MTDEAAVPVWERLRSLVARDDLAQLDALLATLSGPEVIRALFRLTEPEQRRLLTTIPADQAADIVTDVPDAIAADLIEAMSPSDAASIVNVMASDARADLMAAIEDDEADAILSEMEPGHAADTRLLMSYPPDSAGGLMAHEYLAYRARNTAREVILELSDGSRDLARYLVQYIFVTGRARKLLGTVRFRDLVFAAPETPLRDIMTAPMAINVHADLETVIACFDEVDVLTLPVTTDEGRMAGVLLRSDVDEALTDRIEEDHLKSQGIIGGEEVRAMPVVQRSRRRLSWLTINIGLNIIAASVIAVFEETLAAVIALAVFLPIVSDMSGCSGYQAVAVSMRELTLGIVNARDVMRVWWQELKVGVINGVVLGVMLGLVAWAWKDSAALGGVIAAALAINTLIAVSVGGAIPLILKRLGADPAIASGPVLTTVTDMCGFFLVLGIATLALPWLRPG